MIHHVTIIGAGYVGLTTALCLTRSEIKVTVIENNQAKFQKLQNKTLPIHEKGLADLFEGALKKDLIQFAYEIPSDISGLIFVCVGTPLDSNKKKDLSALHQAIGTMNKVNQKQKIFVIRSTVPVGTMDGLCVKWSTFPCDFVFNPEFLREGTAVEDFFKPDRIVIAYSNELSFLYLKNLYHKVIPNVQIIKTGYKEAELSKYAANAMLACRLSFINECSTLADSLNINMKDIVNIIGQDKRIGKDYLSPSWGFGGPCLPKDLKTYIDIFQENNIESPMSNAILSMNLLQQNRIIQQIQTCLINHHVKRVCIFGASFKGGCDDTRGSFIFPLLNNLSELKISVSLYEPCINNLSLPYNIHLYKQASDAISNTEALIILNQNNTYKQAIKLYDKYDYYVFDLVNLLDNDIIKQFSYQYKGIGISGEIFSHDYCKAGHD